VSARKASQKDNQIRRTTMEKYSTYKVYKNINTGEILRVAFNPETEDLKDELQKIGEDLSQ